MKRKREAAAAAELKAAVARTTALDAVPAGVLYDLLLESYSHHEYCGWGDAWERECSDNLRIRIETALFGKPV